MNDKSKSNIENMDDVAKYLIQLYAEYKYHYGDDDDYAYAVALAIRTLSEQSSGFHFQTNVSVNKTLLLQRSILCDGLLITYFGG